MRRESLACGSSSHHILAPSADTNRALTYDVSYDIMIAAVVLEGVVVPPFIKRNARCYSDVDTVVPHYSVRSAAGCKAKR